MRKLFFLFTALLGLSFCSYGQNQTAVPDTQHTYSSLSEALKNPDQVYRLILEKKKLTAFPPEITKFKNLKYLSLSRNRLKSLPPEIGNLTNIEHLDVSRNYLLDIPAEIGKLKKLRVLVLYKNEIDTLPPEMGQLENLEQLDLWDNELSGLPETMQNLKKLQEIDLRGILFTQKQQLYFRELLPNTTIYLSPGCNTCKD